MHGVHNYLPQDLLAAVEFLEANAAKFPFAEVVARSVALDQIHSALAATQSAIRIAIAP